MKATTTAVCSAAILSLATLSASAGSEGSLLEYAEAIRADSMNHASLSPIPDSLKASFHYQFRYNYNQRGSESTTFAGMPDNDLTVGFTIPRAKLTLEGKVTDDISAKVKLKFSQSSGTASLEDAVMKWKLSDTVTFRAGQFKPGLLREENLSAAKQLAAEHSSVNKTFTQGYTQGIEFAVTEDDWRFLGSFNDGIGSSNTYYTSATEADLAFTVRGEMRFGDASWGQYKQFTSWRGSNSGLMIGAAYHHQWMGETNPSTTPATEMGTGTIDASYVADGWNLYGAAVWRTTDTGTMTITDAGYLLQGGVFVSDQNEFFGRWDLITPSDSNPVVVGVSGAEDFNVFTVGWNHYLIPESHAAKFTLEAQVYPDPTTESIVRISGNILPDSTGDQFAITAQFQLLF